LETQLKKAFGKAGAWTLYQTDVCYLGGLARRWTSNLRTLPLKVLNDVARSREPVDATNSILGSFNAKQIADGSMGLNETQNHPTLCKFGEEVQEHSSTREIDRRRS